MGETISQAKLLEKLDLADGGWDGVLAIFTDCVRWTAPCEFDKDRLDNLLEVRAYHRSAEAHAVRTMLDSDFAYRLAKDDSYDWHFDDAQYLDKNDQKSCGRTYVTTGGGEYKLPVENATKVLIRNYVCHDEHDGMARIVDFRIVGLE